MDFKIIIFFFFKEMDKKLFMCLIDGQEFKSIDVKSKKYK